MINLQSDLSPNLWSIHADSSEIENTVVNLVINARDAMPDGGNITVETRNISYTKEDIEDNPEILPGDYIQLSVTGDGIGMSDEDKERIFEPFFTTKRSNQGTGLGLASIHGFINQSGGYVRVYSELTRGTTVALYLPKYSDVDATQDEAYPTALQPTNSDARILVVEDNDMVRNVTVKKLQVLGFQTEQVCNGKAAIDFLSLDANFDLILSDVVMGGGMSGFDVANWVNKNLPQCSIILISGYNAPEMEDADHKNADLNILQKPYTIAELQYAIQTEITTQKNR